jgi:hypothetical protein
VVASFTISVPRLALTAFAIAITRFTLCTALTTAIARFATSITFAAAIARFAVAVACIELAALAGSAPSVAVTPVAVALASARTVLVSVTAAVTSRAFPIARGTGGLLDVRPRLAATRSGRLLVRVFLGAKERVQQPGKDPLIFRMRQQTPRDRQIRGIRAILERRLEQSDAIDLLARLELTRGRQRALMRRNLVFQPQVIQPAKLLRSDQRDRTAGAPSATRATRAMHVNCS